MKRFNRLFLSALVFGTSYSAFAANPVSVQGVLRDASGNAFDFTAPTPSGITVQFRQITSGTGAAGVAYDTVTDYGPFVVEGGFFSVTLTPVNALPAMLADPTGWYIEVIGNLIGTQTIPATYRIPVNAAPIAAVANVAGGLKANALTNAMVADGALSGAKITAGTLPGSTLAAGAVDSTALGAGAVTSSAIASGAVGDAQISAVAPSKITAGGATSGQVLSWNGTHWVPVNSAAGGTVTSVATGTGLTGGPITSTGTLAVDVGAGSGQIPQLDSGGKLVPGTLPIATNTAMGGLKATTGKITLDGTGAITNIAADTAAVATSATSSTSFTGSLVGDVTGTQGSTVVSQVGGVSAANVASGATAANSGTAANTASTLVARDGSKGFALRTLRLNNSGDTFAVSFAAPAALGANYSLTLPTTAGSNNQVLTTDGAGVLSWSNASAGSVTSVGLSMPSMFSVTNSPVTSTGTLTATLASQSANTFLAAPDGSAGAPTFRTIVSSDIPALSAAKITSGTLSAGLLPIATDTAMGGLKATTGKITLDGTGAITNIAADTAASATSATDFSGSLVGDVTGTQGATVVSQVGGVSAANVASGATAANAATSANTASKIVARDGSGNFSAGTITGSLTGAASLNVLKAGDTMTGALKINTATTADSAAQALIATNAVGNKGLVIQGKASQTANLQEWQDSTGTPLASVNSAGKFVGDGSLLTNLPVGGTVTSVGLSLPSVFTVSNSPVTTSGTLTGTLASQTANTVWAAPDGSAGAPTFRNLASGDIPALSAAKITSGTLSAGLLPIATDTAMGGLKATTGKITLDGTGAITNIAADTAASATSATDFSGSLVGDVTGTQSATVVSQVGGVSAANVASGATAANAATSANTASSLVARDGSKGFSLRTLRLNNSADTFGVSLTAPAALGSNYSLTLPMTAGSNNQVLTTDGAGVLSWSNASAGSVTSVGLSMPSMFSVTNSPVTSTGTLTATLASQSANTFLAAPDGSAGAPTFRTIVSSDIPALSASKITSGTLSAGLLPIATDTAMGGLKATTGKITLDGTGAITNIAADTAAVATSSSNFSGSLAGDVTGTQSATVVSQVGGVSAANVASGATAANAATSANTASKIVARDGSGNFSAGTITGSLTGAASLNVLKAGDTMTGALKINTATTADPLAQGLITTGATTNKGLVVQGQASQTANLQEWQSSTGTALASVNSAGKFVGDGSLLTNITASGVSGTLPVANGGTGTATGSITGTTALTFAAGGSNQNVTLTPSGSGYTLLGGNVGIGTTSPGSALSLEGSNGVAWTELAQFKSGNAGGLGAGAVISIQPSSASGRYDGGRIYGGRMNDGSGNRGMRLAAVPWNNVAIASETVYLDLDSNGYFRFNGGNVGIGTTTPASKLHVGVAPTASANYGLVSLGSGAFDGSTAGYFAGSSNGTVQAINAASGYTGNLVDYQVAGVSKFKVSNAGVVTGDGSGLTNLPTSALSGTLPVANGGTGTATGSITGTTALTFAAGGSNQNVTLTPSGSGYTLLGGNVGLGTASPVSKLHLGVAPTASANFGTLAIGDGPFDGATSGFFTGSASGTHIGVNAASGSAADLINLQVAGSSKFKVTSTGVLTAGALNGALSTGTTGNSGSRIGAGGANPGGIFGIQGESYLTGPILRVTDNGSGVSGNKVFEALSFGNTLMLIKDNGNVGIGTSAPASRLHIGVAPTASANYGLVSLGSGAFDGSTAGYFTGSSNGTVQAINAASGYTGNLVDYQVAGVSKFKVSSSGVITGDGSGLTSVSASDSTKVAKAGDTMTGALKINTATTADSVAQLLVATNATSNKGLVVQAKASQTAALTEWQNSSGTPMSSVGSDGAHYFGNNGANSGKIYTTDATWGPLAITSANGTQFTGKLTSTDSPWEINGYNGLKLASSNSLDIQIMPSRYVGVNTASPGSTLDVKGTLRLSGSSSGYVGFAPAAAAGSTTYTLPAADGTSGQVMTTNASGVLSWTSVALTGSANTFSSDQTFNGSANTAPNQTASTGASIMTRDLADARYLAGSSAYLASDVSVTSSTTFADVSGFSATVVSGGVYEIVVNTFVTVAANGVSSGGYKWQIAGQTVSKAAGTNLYSTNQLAPVKNALLGANALPSGGDSAANYSSANWASGTICTSRSLVTFSSSGAITLQFAQNSSSSQATVLNKDYTYWVVRRIQ